MSTRNRTIGRPENNQKTKLSEGGLPSPPQESFNEEPLDWERLLQITADIAVIIMVIIALLQLL